MTRRCAFRELGGSRSARGLRVATEAIVANGDVVVFDIERVVEGTTATVRLVLAVGLAEGPLLIQGVPGVGKVKLAELGAGSIDCSVRRIQITGSLLAPAEVELAALWPRGFAWRAASAETVAGGVR